MVFELMWIEINGNHCLLLRQERPDVLVEATSKRPEDLLTERFAMSVFSAFVGLYFRRDKCCNDGTGHGTCDATAANGRQELDRANPGMEILGSTARFLLTAIVLSATRMWHMRTYTTREAALKLGIDRVTLQRYIAKGLISVPTVKLLGGGKFREWADRDVERVRKQLPKIKNGRRKKVTK